MLKAVLLTSIAGFLTARLPPLRMTIIITLLVSFEVWHLSQTRDDHALVYLGDFAALEAIGEAAFLIGLAIVL